MCTIPGRELSFHDIPDSGDHMKVKDFLSCCEGTAFIDYDGFGKLATRAQESTMLVKPSMYYRKEKGGKMVRTSRKIPRWATHVVWYNK